MGPALGRAPIPVTAIVVAAIVHGALAAAVIIGASVWTARQPKTYVINLVPAVAATGAPDRRPAPTPPARPDDVVARTPPKPADLPVRPTPSEMPAREAPIASPLPDRTMPSRPPALPRTGDKELPTVPSSTPITKPAPAPAPATAPPPRRELAVAPPRTRSTTA
jgi:hypothetical protein